MTAPQELYCSSADWMERNLFHRVEMSFPILDPEHLRRILDDLEIYLQDNVQAWILDANGTYRRALPDGAPVVSAQSVLLERYASRSA